MSALLAEKSRLAVAKYTYRAVKAKYRAKRNAKRKSASTRLDEQSRVMDVYPSEASN